MSRLNTGVPPAPGVRWLASRARCGVCVCLGVHGMQTPFRWPRCPSVCVCVCAYEQHHRIIEEGLHGSGGRLSYWGHALPRSAL